MTCCHWACTDPTTTPTTTTTGTRTRTRALILSCTPRTASSSLCAPSHGRQTATSEEVFLRCVRRQRAHDRADRSRGNTRWVFSIEIRDIHQILNKTVMAE